MLLISTAPQSFIEQTIIELEEARHPDRTWWYLDDQALPAAS